MICTWAPVCILWHLLTIYRFEKTVVYPSLTCENVNKTRHEAVSGASWRSWVEWRSIWHLSLAVGIAVLFTESSRMSDLTPLISMGLERICYTGSRSGNTELLAQLTYVLDKNVEIVPHGRWTKEVVRLILVQVYSSACWQLPLLFKSRLRLKDLLNFNQPRFIISFSYFSSVNDCFRTTKSHWLKQFDLQYFHNSLALVTFAFWKIRILFQLKVFSLGWMYVLRYSFK